MIAGTDVHLLFIFIIRLHSYIVYIIELSLMLDYFLRNTGL